jgi:hypothetical protein
MKKQFEVLYGHKDTPIDEWEVVHTQSSLKDFGPEYIQEMYVRRMNWDNAHYRKETGVSDNGYKHIMREVPKERDYVARMAAREDYKPFEYQLQSGWDRTALPFCYAELVDGQVLFYANESDAIKDKRTKLSLARYLRSKFGMPEYQVAEISEEYGVPYADEYVFKIATTREEIRFVYVNGPNSCMSGELTDKNTPHPVESYACAPLGVAYIVHKDDPADIISRTVVNTELKTYVCIYGADTQMKHHLKAAGYKRGKALAGYKLLRLPNSRVPFIDEGRIEVKILDDDPDHYFCEPETPRLSDYIYNPRY